ncbi:centrosomal protein of 63 kDa-like isoform X2 [Rhopilema esculentum]|uniref:centrosomal protein of 63 kDa-like isoform X2 n=1 Tax=Rhopilema esculentum TaxID=499914 RepID=UPI0031DE7888
MSSTFTGLLRTLKSTSTARDSMLLSSCESELTELMHQIDVMVEKKRLEWQHQIHGIQSQCERKDRELTKLRETVEYRNKEMGQLQQKFEFEGENHKKMISKYESQLGKLKNEMESLKKNYSKLQRNSSRQSKDAEKIADQHAAEKERQNEEIQNAAMTIEKLQSKLRELEVNQEVQDQKLKGLEEQRGAFIEKSELMQNQLVSYQGQLARKKQLLEGLEQKHVAKIAELENEILRYNDEFNVQEETVKSLKRSLQESRLREENGWKEQMHLREEMEGTKAQLQKRENQISVLENDLQSIQLQQKKFESDAERIRSRQEDSILGKSKEHEERFKELERRYLSLQNEFKEKLQEKEERHTAELTGMKTQISSLTEDLHKRDVALAKMSERAGRMEEDLREMSSKHDKKEAELQVSNAQLEALRLENRHLRDSSVEDHLSTTADLRMFETQIAEIEGANARVVAQLEDENTYLKSEIASIRDEHDRLSAVNFELSEREKYNRETQISSPREQPEDDTSERINTLQEQLNHTLRTYESKLKELQTQRKS